jgi:dTDP-4-amino-4,6-dideoxygalactose transaminase
MKSERSDRAIPFVDLAAQRLRLAAGLERAIAGVLEHGQFILGPEVNELERRLAEFCGARHCITCANGTDALQLVLMAEGVGPGDAVFVPAFTFVATAEAAALVGATPVFVDVLRETFNLDAASLASAVEEARRRGLRPRCVIAVDLFGQPADYESIRAVAAPLDLTIIADAAQSFGASLHGRRVGTLAAHTATSFYPAKPLGCYGDGGAIFTDSDSAAELLRSLRFHGKGGHQYDNIRIGLNSRLDTIQAAILLQKLELFPAELAARQAAARRYSELLGDIVQVPSIMEGATSVWAQYTLVVEGREEVTAACNEAGVPTAIYYPIPLNEQAGYRAFPVAPTGLGNARWLASRVMSLPMHPYLDIAAQDTIVRAVRRAVQLGRMTCAA